MPVVSADHSALGEDEGNNMRACVARCCLCESGGGRPGLPVPNKPDGFCGRTATLKLKRVRGRKE